MIVTDITSLTNYPHCLRSQADEEGLTRSSGLHLTQIIHDLEQTVRPRDEWCTEEELAFFGAGGFMWERVFGMAHRDAVESEDLVRPGEITLEGITGSPDLIRISDMVGIETKLTWKSSRRWESLEKNFWAWLVQCKGYAKMFGINEYEIHAFFIAGEWRPPVPCVKSVSLAFTDRELDENWSMLTSHAKRKGWL